MSPMIEARGLGKRFGRKTVLDNLNFTLHAGEPIALIGPNGAGKTTLFSLLCGYLAPSQGSLRIFGHAPGSSGLFGQVSALPQDALLDPNFSVGSQLELYGQLQGMNKATARAEAKRVIQLVELPEHIDSKPTALSHGMKKRVSIAQALLGQPKLVLLDEPTAGLDPANALQIRQLVSKMSGETTFLISSHNLFELERLCGTVLYIEQGRLVQQAVSGTSSRGFMTLQLDQAPMEQVIAACRAMPGILDARSPQKQELVLEYDPLLLTEPDLSILTLLHRQQWRYKQLTLGQTLEQQLFDVAG